jgi:hypothetical protein
MLPEFIKLWGLKLISAGLKAPENPLDRFIEFTILKHLLAKLEIDCVLDVGANCGQFARHLRAIGYRGRIVSFEHIQRNSTPRLPEAIYQSKFHEKILVVESDNDIGGAWRGALNSSMKTVVDPGFAYANGRRKKPDAKRSVLCAETAGGCRSADRKRPTLVSQRHRNCPTLFLQHLGWFYGLDIQRANSTRFRIKIWIKVAPLNVGKSDSLYRQAQRLKVIRITVFTILPKMIVDIVETGFDPFGAPNLGRLPILPVAYARVIQQWPLGIRNSNAENSTFF